MTRTIRYRRWTATNSDDVVAQALRPEERAYLDLVREVDIRMFENHEQALNLNTASMNTANNPNTVAPVAFPKPKPAVTLEPTIRALFYGMHGFCGGGYFHSDWTKDIITKEHVLEALSKLFKQHADVDRTLLYFPDNAHGRWAHVFSFFKEGEEIVLESKKYRTVWVFRVSSHLRSMNSGDPVKVFLLEAKTRTMTEEAIQSRQKSLRAMNASQEQLKEDERIWREWKATSEL